MLSTDNVTGTYLQMFAIHHSTTLPLFGRNAQLPNNNTNSN